MLRSLRFIAIDSPCQAMQLLSTSTNLLHHPIPRGGNSEKLDPAMFEFSSPPSRVPEPSKSPDPGTPHHEKYHTPRKIKILQITLIISWLGFY